jgi:hypothetical protein
MKIKNYKQWDYTLILMGLVLLIAVLSSCSSRNGYGCRGNYSWDRMVWKNTRP